MRSDVASIQVSDGNEDRLGGRRVIVAHQRRHHLYQTARAYARVGRLERFVTGLFVGRPQRLRVFKGLKLGALTPRCW